MAYLTRIEFAELCQMANRNLGNYIKRKNVVIDPEMTDPDGNPMIDTDNPTNAAFLAKREKHLAKKSEKTDEPQKPNKPQQKKERKADSQKASVVAYVTEKEKVELRKKRAETDLAVARYEEMIGRLIPKELMKKIITSLGQSFQISYKDGAEALIAEFSHKKKLTPNESAQMRSVLFATINESHAKSIDNAKKEMQAMLKDLKNGKR